MKKNLSKIALVLSVLGFFVTAFLWSDPKHANIKLNEGQFKTSIPIYSLGDANLSYSIEASGWKGLPVEAKYRLSVISKETDLKEWKPEGDHWVLAGRDDQAVSEVIASLEDSEKVVPSFKQWESAPFDFARLQVCLKPQGRGDEDKVCEYVSWNFRQVKSLNHTQTAEIKASSLQYGSGLSIGTVLFKGSTTKQTATVDLQVKSGQQMAGLLLYPEVLSSELPNKSLNQVKVSVYMLSRGKPNGSPVLTIQNGQVTTQLPFSMGLENLAVPSELQDSLNKILNQLKVSQLTQEDKIRLLDPIERTKLFAEVDEASIKDVESKYKKWSENLQMAMNAPIGSTTTQGNGSFGGWMTGLWHPMLGDAFRVVVEAEANAQPFQLHIVNSPNLVISGAFQWNVENPVFYTTHELELANRILTTDLGIETPVVNSPINLMDWPSSPDQLSPECRAMVESPAAKIYASGVFSGIVGGALQKIIGGVAGVTGVAAVNSDAIKEVAGWVSGAIFDGMGPVDWVKFQLAFYAANAFAWDVKRLQVSPIPEVMCVGDRAEFDVIWFNQCQQPLYGSMSYFNMQYTVTNPGVINAFITGPAMWSKNPYIMSGAGSHFFIIAQKPGTTVLRLHLTDSKFSKERTIRVKDCSASPQKPLNINQ